MLHHGPAGKADFACRVPRYILLPPGPAKNQMIMPASGNISTQRIHSIFSVPDAELWIILTMAKISNARIKKPIMEYISISPFDAHASSSINI